VDLALGLVLVALSEEVLCRGLLYSWLRSRIRPRLGSNSRGLRPGLAAGLWAGVAATLVFAAMHWSMGPRSMISAFVFGLACQAGRWGTGTIWPGVAAHYAVNLYVYA
jgi:membrane protease YdiL (CAAX protease family)